MDFLQDCHLRSLFHQLRKEYIYIPDIKAIIRPAQYIKCQIK